MSAWWIFISDIFDPARFDMKNIIFDFGNVLFDLDLPKIPQGFAALAGDQYQAAMEQLRRNRVFELYETGGMDTEEFLTQICNSIQPAPDPEQVKTVWNAIFVDLPKHRLEFLLTLRQRYKVFLLSNINDLHLRWIEDYLIREHGIHDFESRYFDGVYYSHLIRLRKPDQDIYEYVLADAELQPHETVFFDDLKENIAAAEALGIRGAWHDPAREIVEHVGEVLKGE
jgi:glucose-1-phosphatase